MADSAALLRAAAATLPGETPRLDAELLLAHLLGCDRLELLARPRPVPDEALARFRTLLARRRAHEPVAYLVGRREFWSLDLEVTPDVLIPRPDSETLIEAAREALAGRPPGRILDLGTGSGALLLAALSLWPAATGLGVDRSAAALAVARRNARRLGLEPRAGFREGDWGRGLDGPFDLVLANPPYVPDGAALAFDVRGFEPHGALFAGHDGLDAMRRLLPDVARLTAPGGVALIEFGEGQAGDVLALGAQAGLDGAVHQDLGGRPRCVAFRRFPLGKADGTG
jgi:release factor glutamine methyltransferase